jgi:leucyl-tRNA synthetase
MPGYAGSSWYFLRYMDPGNEKNFVAAKLLIIGGRLICISGEQNMQSGIYYIAACGRSFF